MGDRDASAKMADTSKQLTLILGGVRAGKSTYAQQLAADGGKVLVVATAEAGDDEMAARIRAHRSDRPAEWDTLEEPLDIVRELAPVVLGYDTILLDCLTLWVSNLLLKDGRTGESVDDVVAEAGRLLDVYREGNASWIVVSNEVGLGVVPTTKLGRIYTDALGQVNRIVAAEADNVHFMAAGLPLTLKGSRQCGY